MYGLAVKMPASPLGAPGPDPCLALAPDSWFLLMQTPVAAAMSQSGWVSASHRGDRD